MQPKTIPPEIIQQLISEPFVSRFWSHVKIGGKDECWPWQLYIKKNGYGQVGLGGKNTKPWRGLLTHRVAWIIANGKDAPDGLDVLHSCESSRSCCNPSHLTTGTHLDNMKTMKEQGHYGNNAGERSGNCKLTNEIVMGIRIKYASGEFTQKKLGEMHDIAEYHVYKIVHRKCWKHI